MIPARAVAREAAAALFEKGLGLFDLSGEQIANLEHAEAWVRGKGVLSPWFNPADVGLRLHGRSTVIVVAVLRVAIERPGEWVFARDHAAQLGNAAGEVFVRALRATVKRWPGPGWFEVRQETSRQWGPCARIRWVALTPGLEGEPGGRTREHAHA